MLPAEFCKCLVGGDAFTALKFSLGLVDRGADGRREIFVIFALDLVERLQSKPHQFIWALQTRLFHALFDETLCFWCGEIDINCLVES